MEVVQLLRWQGLQAYRQIMKPALLGVLYFDRTRIPQADIRNSLPTYSPKIEQLYPADLIFKTIQLTLRQKLLANQKQLQKAIKSDDKEKLQELADDFARQFENAHFISKGLLRMYKHCLLKDMNKRKTMEKYVPLQIIKHMSEQDVGSPLYKQELIDFFILLEKKGMSNWKSFFFDKEEKQQEQEIEVSQEKPSTPSGNPPSSGKKRIKKKIKKRTRKFL